MTSKAMQTFVDRMQGDWAFVAEFLDDPETVVGQLGISGTEADAILAQNFDALMKLGLGDDDSLAAFSGAHTPTCSSKCTGP